MTTEHKPQSRPLHRFMRGEISLDEYVRSIKHAIETDRKKAKVKPRGR
jgi:hypothetical protein